MKEIEIYMYNGLMDRIKILTSVMKYFNTEVRLRIIECTFPKGTLKNFEIYPNLEIINVKNISFENKFFNFDITRNISKHKLSSQSKQIINIDGRLIMGIFIFHNSPLPKYINLVKYLRINYFSKNYLKFFNKNIIFVRTRKTQIKNKFLDLMNINESIKTFDFSKVNKSKEYLLISESKEDITFFDKNVTNLYKYENLESDNFTDTFRYITRTKNDKEIRKYLIYGLNTILIISHSNEILSNNTYSGIVNKNNLFLFKLLFKNYQTGEGSY